MSDRVGYSRGTKEPGSHEIFRLTRNFCCNSRCFVASLTSRYFCISCLMKKFFPSHTICRKYFLVTGRNILSLQLINCHRKKIIVTERNLLPKANIFCHKKNFFVAGTNVLFEAEITCQRKIFLGIRGHFLSQTVTYGHRKEFHATGRNFMPQLVISWKKFLVRARSVLSQEDISLH